MDRRWSLAPAVLLALCVLFGGGSFEPAAGQAKPEGEVRWATEYIWPSAIGPRVAEPALLMIDPYPWSAPLQEVRLKQN